VAKSAATYPGRMRKPLKCKLGLHTWHTIKDAEDQAPALECYRCGKLESRSTNVAVRIGWPGRGDS
jgi:hypothetical protein